ncbi:MAG: type I pullulanase [Acidobacteriota bacterium]|nr:MAG: type I pullulanase [Acidobacteriota bacterium]
MRQDESLSRAYNGHARALGHPADEIVTDLPLGALYTPERTEFRVWAPTASVMTMHLYDSPTGGRPKYIAMKPAENGCWETTLLGDQLGKYYTYTAAGDDPRFNPRRELLDPYANCVTAHNGRSIIWHDTTPVAPRPEFPISEAIIYEMHVRDFTIDPDSGIQRRGKYLGLTEFGTHLTQRPDIVTGLDHLIELGVNVVQLMPVSEFYNNKSEDLYGWGYDVVHHRSPDGWYATERFDGRRVTEVKRMIDELHRQGIRVTLDVVFNHTYESIEHELVFSFEGLVPGYYYRLKEDGSYWNGSGTGNEFRSEAPMVRRYILDTLRHWVTEYRIDGFRFDLIGLMDSETIRQIVEELRAIDPNLLIYGEPWAGGSTPIMLSHKGVQRGQGWAVFNDHYRDALKGNVFNARETGFIQSGAHVSGVKNGICGAIDDFADSPLESINYVECHDNHTLWDRLMISTVDDARITNADRRAMDKLAAAVIFTSQGIPFIQSGQEFLRGKGGNHNSYDRPDYVNMIRWKEKAAHKDVYDYYRGLIALRMAHPIFRLETEEDIRSAITFLDEDPNRLLPHGFIGYVIEDVTERDEWSRAVVLINPNARAVEIEIPDGEWQVYGDGREISLTPLRLKLSVLEESVATVAPRSVLILGEGKSYSTPRRQEGQETLRAEGNLKS